MRLNTVDRNMEVSSAHKKRKQRLDFFPYQLLIPSIILLVLVNGYPVISGLLYSFQDGTLLKKGTFIGLENYAKLMTMPDFWHSLYFSAVFAVFSVLGSYGIGLGLALLLDKDMFGRGFIRVALMVPWIVPSIVSIVSWRWIIGDQNALVNVVLHWFGIEPILFLADEHWATFSVILIKVWRSFPFMMISILAALQAIDHSLYEAARIDGANRWQVFRYITFPQLNMVTIISCILMTIWCFNDFETIWLLTAGGPASATENLMVLAFKYTFTKNDVGIGSSIAIISLIILMGLAVLMLKKQKSQE